MKNKGITLIALIITIIVLLILAGVSISLLTGQDSIIGKAQEGKTKYENASRNEAETINSLLNMIGGGTPAPVENPAAGTQVGETVSNIKQIADGDGNRIPVPVGFSYLTGTKSTGFVIKNDEDNNEFVWIPCDLASNNPAAGTLIYQTYDWVYPAGHYYEGEIIGLAATEFAEYYTSDATENENIINEIDLSIGTYKGYYIGRYEAGTETQRTEEGQELTQVVSKATGTSKVYAYNYVNWHQALAQAEGLYNVRDNNVWSELINGRGWDTALKFIEQVDSTYPLDSIGKGWFKDNYSAGNSNFETGKPVGANMNKIKNIYDMGGNVVEWTADDNNFGMVCVRRGGSFDINDFTSASHRNAGAVNFAYLNFGFRIVLYLPVV